MLNEAAEKKSRWKRRAQNSKSGRSNFAKWSRNQDIQYLTRAAFHMIRTQYSIWLCVKKICVSEINSISRIYRCIDNRSSALHNYLIKLPWNPSTKVFLLCWNFFLIIRCSLREQERNFHYKKYFFIQFVTHCYNL